MSPRHPINCLCRFCSSNTVVGPWAVDRDVKAERERAHELHGATSMRSYPIDDLNRLAILIEEAGECAKPFNEYRHGATTHEGMCADLRTELVQLAAMATDWAHALDMATSWACECGHCWREPGDPIECPKCIGSMAYVDEVVR